MNITTNIAHKRPTTAPPITAEEKKATSQKNTRHLENDNLPAKIPGWAKNGV
jgi:hypothetical protein